MERVTGATVVPLVPGMTWNEALVEYRIHQQAAGRAKGTIRLHQHYLSNLADQHPRGPWHLTRRDLERALSVGHWSPETRKSCRSALRGFYRWGHGMGHIADDPSASLPTVTVPAAVARPTPEYLVRLLVQDGSRVGVMAMLAAYCGLRRGEIARVHSRDLVGDELLIHGKGGKVRAVPVLHPLLLGEIKRADGWLFPNGYGSHLSAGHVGKLLSQSMPEGWTAHTLRHRMASVSYAATRDLLGVGAVLGHSRPETTQRYIRLPDDSLRAAVMAASKVA